MDKLYILETLMDEFLAVDKEDAKNMDIFAFVKENVDANVKLEDIIQYGEVLECLMSKVDSSSERFNKYNKPSLIALVAYSFYHDIDLDEWIVDFFAKNHTYIQNQQENYRYMVDDLNRYEIK